ncbi:MAG: DUF349 domain-containing protein [Desulfobulbaceae bacterium]|nr:DUF349 domain-containing protein [Desulfobulbaceae bacterium]
MVLSLFNKPKWQHRDAEIRLTAVQEMTTADQEILANLARQDQDQGVRLAALAKLDDLALLGELAGEGSDLVIAEAARQRRDQLFHAALLLATDLDSGQAMLAALTSQELLADLAGRAEQPAIRVAAAGRLNNQELLAGLVENNCAREMAADALAKIDREDLLERLTSTASGKTTRRLAAEKLAALVTARTGKDPAAEVNARLQELAAQAARLGETMILDQAEEQLAQLQAHWHELDPESAHPAAAAFTASCTRLLARLEEVRQCRLAEAAKAARYEEQQNRLEGLCLSVEKLVNSSAPEAATEVKNAEAQWRASLSGEVVASAALGKRFEQAVRAFQKTREKVLEEQATLAALTARLDEADKLQVAGELDKAYVLLESLERELAACTFKHLTTGALPQRSREMLTSLNASREERLRENLARRRELCERAAGLLNLENLSDGEKLARELRQAWQQLPMLAGVESETLAAAYQESSEAFAEKLSNYEHERDWQLWANLTLKQELVNKVEGLGEIEDLGQVLENIKQAQASWKEIGPIPPRLSQKLWDRFHAASNQQYERCAPFLEEQKAALLAVLARKEAICLQAEELIESEAWQKTSEAIKALQNEWKGLPVASRHRENQLFLRFRKACNAFFERRQAFYETGDEERRQNLKDKEMLCEEVEKIVAAPQWNDAGRIRNLQGRWKKIGQAPKAHNDAVWERFRGACDRYFAWLEAERLNNLRRKEELCQEVEKILAEITPETILKEVGARLVELQQQWKEIGPAPQEHSEPLWQRFNTPCHEFFKDRHRQFEEAEKERRQNLAKKEELLHRAEEQAAQGNNRQTAEALQAIQKEWQQVGPAPKEIERELNHRFRELCHSFFEGRKQYFTNLEGERLENQRRKESLCLRLENLIGAATPTAPPVNQGLNLAEQLKMAMENNFIMAGRRDEKATVLAEVKRLQEEWKKIGPADRKYEPALQIRFHQAFNSFQEQNKTEKAG